MPIDLEAKSNELKEFVANYESKTFLGEISFLIQMITGPKSRSLENLNSPLRQLLYLGCLNVSSKIPSTNLKGKFDDDELEQMKLLLNEIEEGYNQFFYPKEDHILDDEWKNRRMIAMPSFLSYFNQGELNYSEQIVERVSEYFTPFNAEIKSFFGLEVSDFISFFEFINEIPNKYLQATLNDRSIQSKRKELFEKAFTQNSSLHEAFKFIHENDEKLFDFTNDTGKMFRFSKQDLIDKFGNEKAGSFLECLTINREQKPFLYYTDTNILLKKSIFKIDDEMYQFIETKLVIQGIYNLIIEFCTQDKKLSDRFYRLRGKKLENKIEMIFKKFYKNKCHIHKNYYTKDGNGQDLLIIINGLALIIEAKASKRDEPRRDPDKAYPLILYNFNETIKKGYDQTFRVKSKFIKKEVLQIFEDEKLEKHVIDIQTSNYGKTFSIIITLERFGLIQCDLNMMLEIEEEDEYPLSICIDDLEVFLLAISKLKLKTKKLKEYLEMRELLHGYLITADELEICGAFLSEKLDLNTFEAEDYIFYSDPSFAEGFDKMYHTKGLGFENEINLDKKNGKYRQFLT